MTIIQNTYMHDGHPIHYRFQPAKDDRRHLIVIFSGFRAFGTFDFGGSTTTALKGNILWIEDRFNENFAYYLCQNGEFWIENAVHALIEEIRQSLSLEKNQTSVAGFSKGGSAAIYYGIKYGYENIVSVVPQFRIGSYVQEYWPKVHQAMLGEDAQFNNNWLDDILPNLVKAHSDKDVNIYLISSLEDQQHNFQVEPYISSLQEYKHFNYILTNSPMVREHDKVTRYNIPVILSLLAMFNENISPTIGFAKNGLNSIQNLRNSPTLSEVKERNEITQNLDKAIIKDGRLFIDGYAFIRGYEATSYSSVDASIIFVNTESKHEIQLASTVNRDLSYAHFDTEYCDYSFAAFTTYDRRGISLEHIDDGVFDIDISVGHNGAKSKRRLGSIRQIDVWGFSRQNLIRFCSSVKGSNLVKRPILSTRTSDTYVELTNSWSQGSILHIEGYFVAPGVPASSYSTSAFYLVLTDPASNEPMHVFDLATGNRSDAGSKIDDSWVDYSKAYFATPKYQGIDISGASPGLYDCWVTARYSDSVFSSKISTKIRIRMEYVSAGSKALPTIGIIGSSATRDNFSSGVVPDWPAFYELHGSQYQSSLISLMAAPVAFDNTILSNSSTHAETILLRDMNKSYLQELRNSQPDVLIFDLYADVWLGCLGLKDSWVTNNATIPHFAEFYRSLDEVKTLSMNADGDEYISMFTEAVSMFEVFRKDFLPQTKIVLNSARAVSSRIRNGKRVLEAGATNDRANRIWTALDEIFTREVIVDSVIPMPAPIQGDSNHVSGPGPIHYEKKYYREFRASLLETLSGKAVVEIILS